MANKKISELQSRTPALSDLMLVGDPSSGYSYKCTVTALATIIETDIADGYVTIGTTQTISGAKTFSNNLTLTSVANATTTQTKFLTLNGSNVVNYRTGAEVLSDIGGANDSLVVHKAGDETITGIKTFTPRAKFDAGINLKQGSGASLDTGYSAISADATTFYFHRATSIAALSVNNLTATRTYTLQDANGTLAFLSDITSALTGYVPTSRTLIINGVGFDLSANRTWNVGTVTSVGLSTGTTGTDVNVSGSPVTSSGTITLNIPTASATNRGALSSTDWTTFNNKQNAITLTTTGTSGAATLVGSTLNIPQYQAVLTNPVTGTGTTNYIPKFTSSSAIGNSQIFDNGTNIGIGTTSPAVKLQVIGDIATSTRVVTDLINGYTGGSTPLTIQTGGAQSIVFGTTNTERMRLDASGRVSIGGTTVTDGHILNIQGSSAANNIGIILNKTNATAQIWGITNVGALTFYDYTNSAERMRLDASGNLGIGTSSPAAKLDVNGTGRFSDNLTVTKGSPAIDITSSSGTGYALLTANNNAGFLRVGRDNSSGSLYGTAYASLLISQGSYPLFFGTNDAIRLTLDASGNLGLGVTPSAWGSAYKSLEGFYGQTWFYRNDALATGLTANTYNNGTNWIYSTTNAAQRFEIGNVGFAWFNAASGTAGNAISFTQAMTLDASGRLGIGVTNPSTRLDVNGVGTFQTGFQVVNGGAGLSFAASRLMGQMESANLFRMYITGQDASTKGALEIYNATSTGSPTIGLAITAASNVGIGTTSPGSKLSVIGSADFAYFYDNSTTDLQFQAVSSATIVGTTTSTPLAFKTSNTERMRITSAGNVGIGTSSPVAKLDLYGGGSDVEMAISTTAGYGYTQLRFGASAFVPANSFGIGNGITGGGIFLRANATGDIRMGGGTTEWMRITSGGELLINTTSDAGDYKLQVNGNGYMKGDLSITSSVANNQATLFFMDAGTTKWQVYKSTSNDFRIYRQGSSVDALTITTSDNAEFAGSIKTAAPSGGTAKPIKFGEIVTLGGSNTQGVRVEIDGTVYYLVTGYLP